MLHEARTKPSSAPKTVSLLGFLYSGAASTAYKSPAAKCAFRNALLMSVTVKPKPRRAPNINDNLHDAVEGVEAKYFWSKVERLLANCFATNLAFLREPVDVSTQPLLNT